ncbi:MAG: hypothetical protein SVW77_02705 [Candidatus Nanohaloarchaea archaeon]|nr:hypothetical protein [Candidatus Nanohaloarchaea archaeon]
MRKGVAVTSPFEFLVYTVFVAFAMAIATAAVIGSNPLLGGAVGCTAGAVLLPMSGPVSCGVGAGVGAVAPSILQGTSTDTGYQRAAAVDTRTTGNIPNLILRYRGGGGGEPFLTRLQRYIYCEEVADAVCPSVYQGVLEQRFREAVDAAIPPDRAYDAVIRYGGETIVSASSGDDTYRSAVYETFIPVFGGGRATLSITVEGIPGGYRWSE